MGKRNILLLGAGGVSHVAAHKLAQNNDLFGDIYLASRSLENCEQILESIERKKNYKNTSKKIQIRQIDALNIPEMVKLMKDLKISITVNLVSVFCNMSILEACIETGSAYIDTAIHEEPNKVCEDPPWYANYEWKRKDRCQDKCITAILGAGFDPGVVNAYVAYAKRHFFDDIDTIDIMDVNAGNHGRYFSTNFDPEINFREFVKVWTWIDRQWVCKPIHSEKKVYDFPVVGKQTIYLTGHDEIHSLSKNIDANSIRFWMGFSDHYINCFNVLKNIGLLSEKPVRTAEGVEVVPLKVVKACLPDPKTLAPYYRGKTCIGDLIVGTKDGRRKEFLIYSVCDHRFCYEEVESQAISYTAGTPVIAAAILIAKGDWDVKKMVNVEELVPDPYLDLLKDMGISTETMTI
ncbi:saccharopine dehydrogenase [Endomicrobiia bacterium]|uniref:saccharopine dehydrogenase family protein n=1 Tax=Endomicrobium trichonymphae TaxID=1408204 RepID=UPI0008660C87|nr:saccharopine dehydrogenase family protein [Candidatus Endomicrobium trichonymphae]GHT09220.1 saccharopine dehydrogenase [Endomicrobiia bacterium]BAV58988.1 putative saccharopine dehydrogenase [Candidatus Endomicrobium trichonymphae]GHT15981.1 saccharopine dehydrogenase [Endomicrobiia bacterium]GHT24377.1 saccharopine dehydrogenase [Endomicrobiia bacterium]GMO54403.1 MAG: saccharopine dehydrogenase family protein [Candidatus Endomicrobium trichonymphae]